jgi:hypothetical protein
MVAGNSVEYGNGSALELRRVNANQPYFADVLDYDGIAIDDALDALCVCGGREKYHGECRREVAALEPRSEQRGRESPLNPRYHTSLLICDVQDADERESSGRRRTDARWPSRLPRVVC